MPEYEIRGIYDVAIPMRDGIRLRADLYRPSASGRFPALIAVSPYPRQGQYLGIPAGFLEAGQTDFWVPRGYAHLIVNTRGTCGSEGTYPLFGEAERRDLYDMIEWAAEQPWCNGNVGMIGVSYFAIEQFYAALERPPHLKAIFPWSSSLDIYREIAWHGGMFSGGFMGMMFNAIGMLSKRGGGFLRWPPFRALNRILERPDVHRRFNTPPRDTLKVFNRVLRFSYDRHPWDDLFYEVAVEHPFYDEFWQARDLVDRVGEIQIPMYLGSDWENVALHLHTPFLAVDHLTGEVPWRIGMVPRGGLQWPWESMHVEALAWYDHWLKGRDTGIMEGPPIRYFVEGAGEWRTAEEWPLPETRWTDLFLGLDGTISAQEAREGYRDYLFLPPTVKRPRNTNPPPLPRVLAWDTRPLERAVDLVGPFVLHLEASSTATDTDWIVKLCDVAPDGRVLDLTQGWLRASHRAVDEERSKPYHPYHPHDRFDPLTPGEPTSFEIEVLPTAHRFLPGHRMRLLLTSQDDGGFAMQGLSHYPLGQSARNTVFSTSRLTVPLVGGAL